jgi:hypothetical protein
VLEKAVDAIVTFNKGIFNLVSNDPIDTFIKRLEAGELINSKIKGIERPIPIFLTYPTGFIFLKEITQLKIDSLLAIRNAICISQNVQGCKNT